MSPQQTAAAVAQAHDAWKAWRKVPFAERAKPMKRAAAEALWETADPAPTATATSMKYLNSSPPMASLAEPMRDGFRAREEQGGAGRPAPTYWREQKKGPALPCGEVG